MFLNLCTTRSHTSYRNHTTVEWLLVQQKVKYHSVNFLTNIRIFNPLYVRCVFRPIAFFQCLYHILAGLRRRWRGKVPNMLLMLRMMGTKRTTVKQSQCVDEENRRNIQNTRTNSKNKTQPKKTNKFQKRLFLQRRFSVLCISRLFHWLSSALGTHKYWTHENVSSNRHRRSDTPQCSISTLKTQH